MASVNDKITDVRNAARPNSARVSSGRSAGGTTLACDSLTGWPTASKVHFVTYQIDSQSNPVAGTQLDCYGIVSGSNIGSLTIVDGTDTGNAVNDVVEMLPTAAWGQDLAEALTVGHTRTGAHIPSLPLTSPVLTTPVITDYTSAGHTHQSTAQGGILTAAALPALVLSTQTLSNPYQFAAYKSSATQTASTTDLITYDVEDYDTNSNFASSLYTAPVAGYYHFDTGNYVSSAATSTSISAYVNGSAYKMLQLIGSSAGDQLLNGSFDIKLALNDTVGIHLTFSGGGTRTVQNISGGNRLTWFSGYLKSQT